MVKKTHNTQLLSQSDQTSNDLKNNPKNFNLENLFYKIYQKFLPIAQANNLSFNLDFRTGQKIINSNELYIETILNALVDNAIKYTKRGKITLTAEQINQQQLKILVIDTGIGVAKNERAKIFEKGFRANDYRVRELTGDGNGLYTCKNLAKKLNTKIELASRLNFGSSFSFVLNF